MGTWCLFDLSAPFPQSAKLARSVYSTQLSREVSPSVAAGSDCLGGQHEI